MPKKPKSQEALPPLLAEETALADAGEAAAVFLHELGNVLNNLLLSARLMQRHAPDEFRQRLTDSCRLITDVAQQMQLLARFRQERRSRPYPVDLSAVAAQVASELNGKPLRLKFELTDTPVPVAATTAEMRRVVRLLIDHALAATADNHSVRLQVADDAEQVRLVVDCSGLALAEDDLRSYFEPFRQVKPGQANLDLAICKNLVRRTGGHLEAAPLSEGVRLVAAWPRAPEK